MPLWKCDYNQCDRPAVQRSGDCILCDRHLCRIHLQDQWHDCPKPEHDWTSYSAKYVATEDRQMKKLSAGLNGEALCARASLLRSGLKCTVDLSPKTLSTMMGGQNCHAEICFEDNVRWIARFRLAKTSSPPVEVRDYVLESEAATMCYIRDHTLIPCPEVYDWSRESSTDNAVGLGYILMEKLDGKPLDWNAASPEQREKIMQQLVDIYLEIERHPFSAIGSMLQHPTDAGTFQIGGVASPTTYLLGEQGPLGPFHSSIEAARQLMQCYTQLIASGQVAGSSPVDAYLTHRFRVDLLDSIWREHSTSEQFFLVHPDDKGDHILVNDSFDIIGILDWEWAQTVPKELAFSSPCMMWPVADFYNGSNALSEDEQRFASIFEQRGRHDLARHVIAGRKVQRLYFFLGGDASSPDRKTFSDLFAGLRQAFGDTDDGWEPWKAKALERYSEDKLLQLLLEEESRTVGRTSNNNVTSSAET